MAALSAARNTLKRGSFTDNIYGAKVGSDVVYAGGLVSMLVSSGTGVILAGQDTDNHRCMGIASETVDGTATSEPNCDVYTEGEFLLSCASATSAWVGNVMVIVDDQTVGLAAAATHDIIVGICTEYVDATHVWVKLNPYHVTA